MSKPRLTLTTQIYLIALAFAVALGVTATVAWIDAGQQAHTRFEREIDDGLDVFKSDFDRGTRDLTALGNWLIVQKNFTDLVQSRDSAGLTRYLESWTELSIADSIGVSDKDGNLLVQLKSGQVVANDPARAVPGIADALLRKRTSGVEQDNAGRLQKRITLPIYASESSEPIGALILSFYLDGTFLQYRSRKLDQEIAIVYGDQLTILTLTDVRGKPWQGGVAPASILKAQRAGKPSDFSEIETEVGTELFKFKPLESPSAGDAAMYGVGIALSEIDNERVNVFRTIWLGLVAIALAAVAGAFLFVRALTTPIRALDRAAQQIGKGDLSEKITLARNDELGDLARQMETMRQQLRDAFQSAAFEKNRYEAVIQSMGVAAVITDHHLNIAAANTAAVKLLCQDHANLIGQTWQDVFGSSKDGKSLPAFWDHQEFDWGDQQNLIVHGRFHLRANLGVTLDVISTSVQVNDESVGYVHILRDAGAEDQLLRAKDEFLMNAAHELRGPLASLRASIELLNEDYAEMAHQDLGLMLRTMQRSVLKFQGLIENLVDIGNIQAGKFRVRPAPTRLDDLVSDALAQTQPMFQVRKQRLQTQIECASPCVVSADRARIVQVLVNLLTNASKYGPEDQPIGLSAFARDRMVVVEVNDRGQGISPEEQENLFKRYYRGRRAEEEGIGIGLGLALAQEIVTAHGGQIGVRSEMGQGTTFWFNLPLAQ